MRDTCKISANQKSIKRNPGHISRITIRKKSLWSQRCRPRTALRKMGIVVPGHCDLPGSSSYFPFPNCDSFAPNPLIWIAYGYGLLNTIEKNEMSDFLDVYFQLIHPEQIIKKTMRLLLISDFLILMWRRCMSFTAQLSYLNVFTIRYISQLYLEKCCTHIVDSIFKNIFEYIYLYIILILQS